MPRPRPTEFLVKESKTAFKGKNWRVIGYVDGLRKQYWFSSEKEAKADAADRNAERAAYGSKVSLDAEARLEAFRASELLRPHGKTIMDAVRYYLRHLSQLSVSVPFSTLATRVREEFVRREAANEVSDRHAKTLRETLNKLEAKFGNRLVSEIKTEELREWLLSLPLAAKTRNKHRGYTSQVFSLALDFGYTAANPVTKIKKFRERSSEENGEKSVLSAEETEKLFRAADPEVIPFLTLSFFCGIRVDTLRKLDWSEIKYDEKRVIVPRYKGKNDLRYRVSLSENALAWLRPHVKESGSLLVPATATNRFSKTKGRPSPTATRRRITKAAEKVRIALPDNAGRNTFISMHVAHYESIDKTALEADNSADIIKKDYLDIVTREEAAKFWAIYPGTK
jgi:integrase